MIRAIFFKEWIKCRKLFMLLLLISIALVAYLFINNANLLRTSGAIALWGQIAEGGYSLFPLYIKMFLPLAALSISIAQYSPEMINKRFKLTLHLPHSEFKIVGAMQLFALSLIGVIYATVLLPSYIYFSAFYPLELLRAMYLSLVPYLLVGVACYFFSQWVIVEPIWRYRVIYLFVALISLWIYTLDTMLGAMTPAIPSLLLIVGASIVASYYSVMRFKDGAQD